jgi:hypothetical protein
MKMLSIEKWAHKVEQLVAKYGVERKYIAAELRYQHHSHTPRNYVYTLYVADIISPTISGVDWKLVLKEAELILRKKGYKKQPTMPATTGQPTADTEIL